MVRFTEVSLRGEVQLAVVLLQTRKVCGGEFYSLPSLAARPSLRTNCSHYALHGKATQSSTRGEGLHTNEF